MRLANRRFVPFYFDLSNSGVAGDAAARAFVVPRKPALGGNAVPTPPVLFMTPAGQIVGEVSNYATSAQVLAAMLRVLREQPTFARPTAEETALTDPLARAELRIDLQDPAGAAALLADQTSARARYLLGRLARWRGDWAAMERHLAAVEDAALADDVRMERAHRLWQTRRFAELEAALTGFPVDSNRFSEARYHLGLAVFHQGRVDAARAIWHKTVTGCSQDPWIYRADWAFCQAKQRGERRGFSTMGARTSLLNRIGYMGRRNPDLAGPPADAADRKGSR